MYIVRFSRKGPVLKGDWEDPVWSLAETLRIQNFRPEGSGHRPETSARLLYDSGGIFGIFRVKDRYVRCIRTRYGDPVYKDSCVEFFVKPTAESGYFNFEFNCGGAFLCSYITDPRRTKTGFREYTPIPAGEAGSIIVAHSLPQVVDPEISEPVSWTIEFFIPFSLMQKYAGNLGEISGSQWKANLYKCGDETSHPHWAAWQPVPELNFHMPEYFGSIRFEAVQTGNS